MISHFFSKGHWRHLQVQPSSCSRGCIGIWNLMYDEHIQNPCRVLYVPILLLTSFNNCSNWGQGASNENVKILPNLSLVVHIYCNSDLTTCTAHDLTLLMGHLRFAKAYLLFPDVLFAVLIICMTKKAFVCHGLYDFLDLDDGCTWWLMLSCIYHVFPTNLHTSDNMCPIFLDEAGRAAYEPHHLSLLKLAYSYKLQ